MARNIDQDEKQIANFVLQARAEVVGNLRIASFLQRAWGQFEDLCLEFLSLFCQFLEESILAAAAAALVAAAAAVVFAVAPLQDHTVTPRVGQLVQTHATSPARHAEETMSPSWYFANSSRSTRGLA